VDRVSDCSRVWFSTSLELPEELRERLDGVIDELNAGRRLEQMTILLPRGPHPHFPRAGVVAFVVAIPCDVRPSSPPGAPRRAAGGRGIEEFRADVTPNRPRRVHRWEQLPRFDESSCGGGANREPIERRA
jgi:hypothetical protein